MAGTSHFIVDKIWKFFFGKNFKCDERLTKHDESTFLACEVLRVTCTAKTLAAINIKGTFAES
jgi:hypothetical protein